MFSTLDILPTYSNPAYFIPVIVDFYPFDIDPATHLFQSQIEVCTNCQHCIDNLFTIEENRYKCPWCSRTYRIGENTQILEQNHHSSLLSRVPVSIPFNYNLIFVLDTCCADQNDYNELRDMLFIALDSLPSDHEFQMALICPKCITLIIEYSGTIVTFELMPNKSISKQFDLTEEANRSSSIPKIKEYILNISNHTESTKLSIDTFLNQLSFDNTLFSQIVLFSTTPPSKLEQNNTYINWITNHMLDERIPLIDGYLLSTYGLDVKCISNQISTLIAKLSSNNVIFNIQIDASITNYKCEQTKYKFASGADHFKCSFKLYPKYLQVSGSTNSSCFGIETTYYRLIEDKVYFEKIWISRQFKKTNNFTTLVNKINPFQLIPHLLENNMLDEFLDKLIYYYHRSCNSLAGDELDYTFATQPKFQWFLRVALGKERDMWKLNRLTPVFCDMDSYFGRVYPLISYWETDMKCIAMNCQLDLQFYQLLGNPPIALFDIVTDIIVYGISELSSSSEIGIFISNNLKSRYPKPIVTTEPNISLFIQTLPEADHLFDKVKARFDTIE